MPSRFTSTGGEPEKGWHFCTDNTRHESADRTDPRLRTAGNLARLAALPESNQQSIAWDRSSGADSILSATRALLIWYGGEKRRKFGRVVCKIW